MEPAALAEKIISLLDESARTSTYKPALLLAMVDRAQEHVTDGRLPVRDLAERVIELYWPQTRPYPDNGLVLLQNQGRQATIVRAIDGYRRLRGGDLRMLPESLRQGPAWEQLLNKVELTLAEWPIPRLQRPFDPFLYDFAWTWEEEGGWAVSRYRATDGMVALYPGVAEALVSLGPLLRPFITRWWIDKAAQLNPNVEGAQSLTTFEEFMFEPERKRLEPVAEPLLDLQRGKCFYCAAPIGRNRQIDHFVPWSRSGDDGLDNLVAACQRCNNAKSATLAGEPHLGALLSRNDRWDADLTAIAHERLWPRHSERTGAIIRSAYLTGSVERPVWRWDAAARDYVFTTLALEQAEIAHLFA